MATKARSVAHSLKLRDVDLGQYLNIYIYIYIYI